MSSGPASTPASTLITDDDTVVGGDRRAGMPDAADGGIAGGFHDHLDIARRPPWRRSVVNVVAAIRPRSQPPDGAAGLARALQIEIDDFAGTSSPGVCGTGDKKHRAEFSRADQRHVDGITGRAAGVDRDVRGSWRWTIRLDRSWIVIRQRWREAGEPVENLGRGYSQPMDLQPSPVRSIPSEPAGPHEER